jgi:hypothetical protein
MWKKIIILGILSLFSVFPETGHAQDSQNGHIETGPSMLVPRAVHTATLLLDGQVLIVGGMIEEGQILDSAELYDPQINTFTMTGHLNQARVEHSATLLVNGQVLIAGGWGRDVLASAELYNPQTGSFTETATMTTPRSGFTATLLQDGRVLMVGGYDNHSREFLASAELYDPKTGSFAATGRLHTARFSHTATLLEDGQVLIAGGGTFDEVWDSAELYDPDIGTFTQLHALTMPRYKHAAVGLPDGSVLLIGGSDASDWEGQYLSTERYDPATQTFAAGAKLTAARFKLRDAITSLDGGEVLIAGGNAVAELYDSHSNQVLPIEGGFDTGRYYMTATRLADNRVLILGGYDHSIEGTTSAWIFEPGE